MKKIRTLAGNYIVATSFSQKKDNDGRIGWFSGEGKFLRLASVEDWNRLKEVGTMEEATKEEFQFPDWKAWHFVGQTRTPLGQYKQFVSWRTSLKGNKIPIIHHIWNGKVHHQEDDIPYVRMEYREIVSKLVPLVEQYGGEIFAEDLRKEYWDYVCKERIAEIVYRGMIGKTTKTFLGIRQSASPIGEILMEVEEIMNASWIEEIIFQHEFNGEVVAEEIVGVGPRSYGTYTQVDTNSRWYQEVIQTGWSEPLPAVIS